MTTKDYWIAVNDPKDLTQLKTSRWYSDDEAVVHDEDDRIVRISIHTDGDVTPVYVVTFFPDPPEVMSMLSTNIQLDKEDEARCNVVIGKDGSMDVSSIYVRASNHYEAETLAIAIANRVISGEGG